MKFKRHIALQKQAGFSLVEILVVIATIAVLAGISISTISSVTAHSRESTAIRHAQLVASMATNALHAGNEELLEAGSKEAALDLLSSGVKGKGSFEAVTFRLGLSQDEKDDVLPYLNYANGLLVANLVS